MGDLSEFATVTIDPSAPAPTRPGFGIAMGLGITPYTGAGTGWPGAELVHAYDDYDAVLEEYAATTPEARMAAAWFAQDPSPESFQIGRLSVAPATKIVITFTQVLNSTVYALKVNGNAVSITSGGSATAAAIAAALETVVDALALSGITSTTVGSTLEIDATAGKFPFVELLSSTGLDYGPAGKNYIALEYQAADPATAIATQLANIRMERDSWYWLINPIPGKALNLAIGAYLLSAGAKVLVAVDPGTGAVRDAIGLPATDLGATLKGLSNSRVVVISHYLPETFADAAAAGSRAPQDPGTWQLAFATLNGIAPQQYTATQVANLTAKNINRYEGFGSLADGSDAEPSLMPGKTASGMWLDERVYRDALDFNLKIAAYRALKNASPLKVPGNDRGGTIMKGALRKVFVDDVASGALGPTEALPQGFTLGQPLNADRSDADRAARIFGDFPFAAAYSSGIIKVTIRGVVEV